MASQGIVTEKILSENSFNFKFGTTLMLTFNITVTYRKISTIMHI